MKFSILLVLASISLSECGLITVDQFQKCVKVFGHGSPSASIAQAFINQAQSKGSMTSKLEAFMAVAQLSWESAGFTARREWACSGGKWSAWPCESYDKRGCPAGQNYFGRGFIQLTHCYNYRMCSRDLYGDDRLVKDPDMVARDDNIAMATAMWFWSKNVHRVATSGKFGATTRAINGGLECTPSGDTNKAKKRWYRFNECLRAAGESNLGKKESGCYATSESGNGEKPDQPDPNKVKSKCGANSIYKSVPGMDEWCENNCALGNCPQSHCQC